MKKQELRDQFETETGFNWWNITEEIEYYSDTYVKWLEEIASRDSRQLSAVPSDFKKRLMESAVLDDHFYHIGEIVFDGLLDELE